MIKKELDPVFLVGARRSGSTLMRVMLDFHEVEIDVPQRVVITAYAQNVARSHV